MSDFKEAAPQSEIGATKASACLPGLNIEIVHRQSPDGDSEQISISLQAVPSFEAHPLPQVLRAGVRACINTDDPAVFGVSLVDETRICREKMGMSQAEVDLAFSHAQASSFLKA